MKVVDFLLADDIRTEIGNKISMMGIYGDSISLTAPKDVVWPVMFKLASLVRLEFAPNDPVAFRFEFKVYWNDEDIAGFEGAAAKALDTALVTLPLVANPIPLPGAGELRFQLRICDSIGTELFKEQLRAARVNVEQH